MNAITQLLERMEHYGSPLWIEEKTLKRNEYLHEAGSNDTNLYYITDGSVLISHNNGNEENIIRFGYKNSLLTALDSFLTDNPSIYSIQAIKKTTLKVMPKKLFMEFINSDPEHMQLWNSILSYTVLSLMEREIDILTINPADRYKRLMQRSPGLFQEIPQKYIAAYLRMAPETLSRLQKS